MLFETLDTTGHEQVIFCHNRDAGLKAIIALHSTRLGPALGGVRMRPYPNSEAALNDALRLSRTMTYKNALAGLNVGGGKAVIIGDPRTDKTEALFRAFGRFVDTLGGRYITSEDVGTDVNDMEQIYLESEYVTGVHQVHRGSGDPAPFTAYGALQALMASLNRKLGHEEVGKASIAIQGLGHIGMELVKLLKERGAKLYVADLNQALVDRAVAEYGAEAVRPDEIHQVAADVFAPCALEGAINEETLPQLKAKIICGTANNQLASAVIGEEVHRRGILYAPDYVVNAGGVMNVSLEIDGYNRERAMRLIRSIYHNLEKVFDVSKQLDISPQQAADQIAEARIEAISKLKLPLGRTAPRFLHKLRGE
ncbi:Glu/Leu/Phe/Val dehydrogenase [Xanthomonas vasicola]|uniref:Glu/Leu/Phe/Val dehydrogenase dimerization domain-containing protein n=1 Tax=Xanthomonas vasicola TaxID=56459 RepID=UPI0001CBEF40|nr:Glu/Leu/Phe/Val dehydrogenase dimerization domain-containing protein [Xanthomonas vasicola]AZR26061.1 Glu/Leu/Phe/Val dehydrogenase [Xanthomonas vasicola pv. arecae]AZR34278.1 Glu/Leu/Phe/Val dehydrogenase [Xanthomonas vasicola]KFA23426.1 leucine dehydrogenase [Xanthomonas vasicola pv. vasculorum NCPPB 1326]KFA26568.1 leucine dehydrogenase [Xanthomonas vasicola pv. vasculorum NCPPB 1381]KFA37898.1 leucine dehydrogenase [Xanthomonas vasicola pv. vasculorum NCPPB 206]